MALDRRAARAAENWQDGVVFSGLTDTAFVYIMSLLCAGIFLAGASVFSEDVDPGGICGVCIDRQRQNTYMYQNITANAH